MNYGFLLVMIEIQSFLNSMNFQFFDNQQQQECQKTEDFQIDQTCSSYTLLVKTFTDDGLAIRNHRKVQNLAYQKILISFNIDESHQFDKTSLNCHQAGQFEQFIHGSVCTNEFSVSFFKKCTKTLLSLTTSENKSVGDNSSFWVFKQIIDIHYVTFFNQYFIVVSIRRMLIQLSRNFMKKVPTEEKRYPNTF
ncbi:hypothetical protein pb186bvf_019720 [Paramecium bursaria]